MLILLEAFEAAPTPITDIRELKAAGLDHDDDLFVFHMDILADQRFVEKDDRKSSETLTGKLIDELTKIRKEQGVSHEKLAEKAALSRASISFIESHKRIPTILSCIRIAKALGIRLGDLINKFDK